MLSSTGAAFGRPLLVAAALIASLSPAGAARPECNGRAATEVGTTGRDTIRGTPGDDVIGARGGNDTVFGEGGNDRLCGGGGNDFLEGSTGRDHLFGDTTS